MNTIPTAEEFIVDLYYKKLNKGQIETALKLLSHEQYIHGAIEFAKLHVQVALKAAGNIANSWENSGELQPEILNAYPLNNIK